MAGNKKVRGIALLMVLSQLLLAFFLVFWVSGQYEKESILLKEELLRQFLGSKDQVMDSMIVMRYIDPLLKEKKGFKVKILAEDSVQEEGKNHKRISYTVSSSEIRGSSDTCIKITAKASDPSDSMLLKGVKLFINEVSLPGKDSQKITWQFSGTDTVLLHKLMAEKMQSHGMNFNMKWRSGIPGEGHGSGIYFMSDHLPGDYGVEISRYTLYIWKKI